MVVDINFEKIKSFDNAYNLISYCYQEMLKAYPDINVSTVSQYIKPTSRSSVYAQRPFKDLEDKLCGAVKMGFPCDKTFEQHSSAIAEVLYSVVIPKKAEMRIAIIICFYWVIIALDRYVKLNVDKLSGLNPFYEEHSISDEELPYLVYLKNNNYSFVSNVDLRKKHTGNYVADMFDSFQIVDKNKLPSSYKIPHIYYIKPDTAFNDNMLRIAYIPFAGFATFQFIDEHGKVWDRRPSAKLGSFTIKYQPELNEENTARILAHLKTAIQKEADIVVFPEFIMSPDMFNSLQKYLATRKQDNMRLKLVFAGTTYIQDGENNCNNVLKILKSNGSVIRPFYYKFSPYVKYSEPDDIEIESCERLNHPGKECILLDIEGVGRILPSICLDFIDPAYTYILAHIFKPNLILIPAWSPSVGGFHTNMLSFANNIHTSSVLCNCCDAVMYTKGEKEKEIGAFIVPSKIENRMNSLLQPISRNQKCYEECKEENGCIQLITIDYSGEQLIANVEQLNV